MHPWKQSLQIVHVTPHLSHAIRIERDESPLVVYIGFSVYSRFAARGVDAELLPTLATQIVTALNGALEVTP